MKQIIDEHPQYRGLETLVDPSYPKKDFNSMLTVLKNYGDYFSSNVNDSGAVAQSWSTIIDSEDHRDCNDFSAGDDTTDVSRWWSRLMLFDRELWKFLPFDSPNCDVLFQSWPDAVEK